MADWFAKHLIELLPPLYRYMDDTGDLETFLKLPAGILDDLKNAIDQFSIIFDVDRCEERFLHLLAALVGHAYDGTDSPDNQRRKIWEAIETYRRKGTIPAIKRSLESIGWQGNLEETFRSALRLNTRSKIGWAKLPGSLYSLGVYRVHSFTETKGVREALTFHHPAGARAFFLQWLAAFIDLVSDLEFHNAAIVRRIVLAFLDETFVLNRSDLGSCRHLTGKMPIHDLIKLTSMLEMTPEIEHADTRVARYHGRQNRMRLNVIPLNGRRLANTSIREDRVSFCIPIYTGRDYRKDIVESKFYLSDDRLNQRTLPLAEPDLRYCFRQKDIFSDLTTDQANAAFGKQWIGFNIEARSRECFQLGRSRLNRDTDISENQAIGNAIFTSVAVGCKSGVTEAADVIDRWRRKGPVFQLNADTLNGRYLTNAYITGERASLEVYVDTDALQRMRVVPLNLNNRPLNTTSLRFSTDRKAPLRIGGMRLNQSGFRYARSSYRWLFRQQDMNEEVNSGFEHAINHYEVTKWPV